MNNYLERINIYGWEYSEKKRKKMAISGMKNEVKAMDRPRLICLDLNPDSIIALKKYGFEVFVGTLGTSINVANRLKSESKTVFLNYKFPLNIHEYDIILIDLKKDEFIEYTIEDDSQDFHIGKTKRSIVSRYPETIFNPRPYASALLNNALEGMGGKSHLVIVFCSESYSIDYEIVEFEDGYWRDSPSKKANIFDFVDNAPVDSPKFGKSIQLAEIEGTLAEVFSAYIEGMTYHQTFYHPKINRAIDNSFIPLLRNDNGDIVSICEATDERSVFYFPQIKDQSNFIVDFLTKVCPEFFPTLFPYSTSFLWKNNRDYWLPNHGDLLDEKQKIIDDYEIRLAEKETEINDNKQKFDFLHGILTKSGDDLVKYLIEFLIWLDFEKVQDMDSVESDAGVLEEDIQIPIDDGLLIIECKGIGGTSTDSDCMQVSKIKLRRCKARNSFDVFALYIVNHQRYLPPINRQNPPFTKNQIQDAINDERGLLSTWQMFNLYYDVESGILTKEEARKSMLNYGLVEFKPSNLIYIDKPTEIYQDGHVCIVNINNVELILNDSILIEKNGRYSKAQITGIKLNGSDVYKVSAGEIGLKLNRAILKNSKLWKQG